MDTDKFAQLQAEIETKQKHLKALQSIAKDGPNMDIAIQAINEQIQELANKITQLVIQNSQQTYPAPPMQNQQQPSFQNPQYNNTGITNTGQQMPIQPMGGAQAPDLNANIGNQFNQGGHNLQVPGYGQPSPNKNSQINQFDQYLQTGNQRIGSNQPYTPNQNQGFQKNNSNQNAPGQYAPQNNAGNQFGQIGGMNGQMPQPGQGGFNPHANNLGNQNQPQQQLTQLPLGTAQSQFSNQGPSGPIGQQQQPQYDFGNQASFNPIANQFQHPQAQIPATSQFQPSKVQNNIAPPTNQSNVEQYNQTPKTLQDTDQEYPNYHKDIKCEWEGVREVDEWNNKLTKFIATDDMADHPGRHPKPDNFFNKNEQEFCKQFRKYKGMDDDE